jgi:rubrerythrin
MEATLAGPNRTGAKVSPAGVQAMLQAADELTPPTLVDTSASDAERLQYIKDADALGSVPPPTSLKGVVKTGVAKLKGGQPNIFLDKIGERIAFERGGTRLYQALIVKFRAAREADSEVLPPAAEALAKLGDPSVVVPASLQGEGPAETLERIRDEEHAHFRMLCECMEQLGGDPSAQTPCADVSATASMGLVQVLTDPRTTLAQCLNTMLIAELTDNAGWELLISLAEDAGESEIAGRFLGALGQEQLHMAIVKSWLNELVAQGAGTPAV